MRKKTDTGHSAEKGASLLGLEILWMLYRVFGLRTLHVLAAGIGALLWLCCPGMRRASPSCRKVVLFARSLSDKLVVMAEGRRLPRVVAEETPAAESFLADVRRGRGVFVLSSHLGTIEVLSALGECNRTFHAWMDFDRTSVFNHFYLRHARRQRVVIHPVAGFGLETAFEAGEIIDGGDCLLMAGDRGDGAFRFAASLGHAVYFVACLAGKACTYRAVISRLPSDDWRKMREVYFAALGELASACPSQHFVWNE